MIEIVKGDFNWKKATPYIEKSRKIEELIRTTQAMETTEPTNAISNYRKAIDEIIAFDKAGPIAASWRRARYPINRLSLLLEKNGDLEGALDAILQYKQLKDSYGLTSAEQKSICSRKQRISKKLNARKTST